MVSNTMPDRHEDWPTLRSEYIEGIIADGQRRYPTLEEVAQRNDLHPSSVRKKAAAEHWTEQRVAFQQRIEHARQQRLIGQIAEMGAEFDVAAMRAARAGMSIVSARLSELGAQAQRRVEAIRQAEQRGVDPTTVQLPEAADTEEVSRLARAAGDWYSLGANARGDMPRVAAMATADIDIVESEDERDERTAVMLDILIGAGALIRHDSDGRQLALATTGNGSGEARNGNGAAPDAVYPDDIGDDEQPEP